MPRIRRPIDADGAAVGVAVEIGDVGAADLIAQNSPVPSAFQTMGLIDTGASRTFIHPMVVSYLGLIRRGFDDLATAGPTGPVLIEGSLHKARIMMGGHPAPQFSVEVAVMSPATRGVLVIIGRDILEHCKLCFNGPGRSIIPRF